MRRQILAGALLLLTGCSVRRFAINRVADALSSGGSAYETDDDIALVGEALPFSLKLIESLLAETPKHKGLLTTACQGFATYAYVYVQHPADVAAVDDLEKADALRRRARRLYMRAHEFGRRGLLAAAPGGDLGKIRKADVPLLYWNAVALGLAISTAKTDAAMLARLPEVDALLDRAIELDREWKEGTLQELQITLAASKPDRPELRKIEELYRSALSLSGGKRASLFVTFAESHSIPKQDRRTFEENLRKALDIDPNKDMSIRLANLVSQRRAAWLLERTDDLILPLPEETTTK